MMKIPVMNIAFLSLVLIILSSNNVSSQTFKIVGTGVTSCYNNSTTISCPAKTDDAFYGQFQGNSQPMYKDNGDGTTTDLVTGLMWQKSPDANGDNDGKIEKSDKLTWAQIQTRIQALNSSKFAGYSDWRLPTMKELYSLTNWNGTDPSGLQGNSTANLVPFLDKNHFPFEWGFVNEGERLIDVQYASGNIYNEKGFDGSGMLFGFNFADGRIKGYGLKMMGGIDKVFCFIAVRGNADYGKNKYVDNSNGTISDKATGLMWTKDDSQTPMNWEQALAFAQEKNKATFGGHKDWRLPNTKELQSIIDYSRSPGSTNSAAIDPAFNCTSIVNEAGENDWPWYWTSTTHRSYDGSSYGGMWAIYICFGRASGWMQLPGKSYYSYIDVHGAGAQRSSPKSGNYLGDKLGQDINGKDVFGKGPQGDIIRINNFVRLVRDELSNENQPPQKPDRPQGNTHGFIDTTYQYKTKSVDLDNDSLSYYFDWGDGKNSGWKGNFASNQDRSFKHSWSAAGVYSIKVKARDIKNAESDWSDTLQVTILSKPEVKDSSLFTCNEILGRPTSNSVTIHVLAGKPMDAYYEYGTDSLHYAKTTEIKSWQGNVPIVVTIGGLSPDTEYFYRMKYRLEGDNEFQDRSSHSFHTSRSRGSAFVFDVEADPHLDSNSVPEAYALSLANILNDKPDFLIDLGDNFMSEKLADKSQKNITDRHLLLRSFYEKTCHSVPLYLVLGNHEGEWGNLSDNNAKALSVLASNTRKFYFSNPEPDAFYTGNSKSEDQVGLRQNYYSFEWGDALFVVLDPYWNTNPKTGWGMTLGNDQYNWFKNSLKSSTAKFKFVFCHNLVGGLDKDMRGGVEAAHLYEWGGMDTNNTWGFTVKRPGWDKPIHQLMVENGVNIFFHGHDHFYGYQEKDGIIYQEVPQPSNRNLTNLSAGSYGYKSGTLLPGRGYLRITVSDTATKVEYVRTLLKSEENGQDQNGSIAHSYIVKSVMTDVNDSDLNDINIKVFPNPSANVIHFVFGSMVCPDVSIKIYELNSGKLIKTFDKINIIGDDFNYSWNYDNTLNDGTYLCKVESCGLLKKYKFIIKK